MVYKLNLFPLYNSLITFGSQDEQMPNIGLLYSGFWIKSPIDIERVLGEEIVNLLMMVFPALVLLDHEVIRILTR